MSEPMNPGALASLRYLQRWRAVYATAAALTPPPLGRRDKPLEDIIAGGRRGVELCDEAIAAVRANPEAFANCAVEEDSPA